MNWYKFHVGDYTTATAHLCELEDLAYRRMLDRYFTTERSLPGDLDVLCRLIRMTSPDGRKAVESVLAEFFINQQGHWRSLLCEQAIAQCKTKSAKARASASSRIYNESHDANAMRDDESSHSVRYANQEPRTKNQEEEEETSKATDPELALGCDPPAQAKHEKPKPKKPPVDSAFQATCRETWASYSTAYMVRYRIKIQRNGKINSQIKNLVRQVGSEAPAIAEFYVGHQGSLYGAKAHDLGMLLIDITKLRLEWLTGRRVRSIDAKADERADFFNRVSQAVRAAPPAIAAAQSEGIQHVEK